MTPLTAADQIDPGLDATSIRKDFVGKLFFTQAKFPEVATRNDCYLALAQVVRDRMMARWVTTARTYYASASRTVAYLSAEYLLGPQLANNLLALGITAEARQAMSGLGLSLDDLIDAEEEPGLGNGGLGRLAACYMDSLATLDVPTIGYGIRYEFGIFEQGIHKGWQVEHADKWLRLGNPWEIPRLEVTYVVGFGGRVVHEYVDGRLRVRWLPARAAKGVAYDTVVLGYGTQNANFLRLWQAVAYDDFDLQAFDRGDYLGAVDEKVASENITKVLYPNDASAAGKQLRLEQQYFFVSCSLQDMIRLYIQRALDLHGLHEKFAVQMNDTHPALAVAELMRLLLDVHGMSWDDAWSITQQTCGYTNHTLLPEALETWSFDLFYGLLPRHTEIVFEINRRFLEQVRARFPGDDGRIERMSLIDERNGRRIRMAHLAVVGSGHVNGVAALHTRLLRETLLHDFAELWPERFHNVTNGVTPRRFMALANPQLTALITESIGEGWVRDLERLTELTPYAEDAAFRHRWRAVKRANKVRFADFLRTAHGLVLDPDTLFDVQVKRIHEYKRQHLALLHALDLWRRVRAGEDLVPRTIVFGGKAAPGYRLAKLIIRLAHAVADGIAADPVARRVLTVVFVPDFSVRLGQVLYPAADLSEQISTAGKEASGTGNMKFALNGALTIGTLDGANVEIRDAVGDEHFFLFGLTAEEVAEKKAAGWRPSDVLGRDPALAALLDSIDGLAPDEPEVFQPLVQGLVSRDPFMVLADFRAYAAAQQRVDAAWRAPASWDRSSILNTARCGWFSSDRSIREYCANIWHVAPVSAVRASP
jgi:glycogen phosphorylase